MTPYILTLRAITGTLLHRIIHIVGGVIGGILGLIWILMILASYTLSPWWLLLMIILVPLSLMVIGLYFIFITVSNKLKPRRFTRQEESSINRFTKNFFSIIERARTPLPVAGFLIAKDVLRNKESSLVKEMINDSTVLRQDFNTIKLLFDPSSTDVVK